MNRLPFVLTAMLALCVSSAVFAQTTAARIGKPPKVVADASTEIINLNTATAAQIETLPGIGPKTADLIVQYRQKNGPFKKIEDRMEILESVRSCGAIDSVKVPSALAGCLRESLEYSGNLSASRGWWAHSAAGLAGQR